MSENLTTQRFDCPLEYKWKVGVWTNYGYQGDGQPNICSQHIAFLCHAIKKPTFQEIFAKYPHLRDSYTVCKNYKRRKLKNSDFIIIRIDDSKSIYRTHF